MTNMAARKTGKASRRYNKIKVDECRRMEFDGIPCIHIMFVAEKYKYSFDILKEKCAKRLKMSTYTDMLDRGMTKMNTIPGDKIDSTLFQYQRAEKYDCINKIVPTYSGFLLYVKSREEEDVKEWLDTTKEGVNFVNRLITKGQQKRKRSDVDHVLTNKRSRQ